jgi:hypothetical protein
MTRPTIGEVQAYFQNEYDRIAADWYGADAAFSPASLVVALGDYAGGYSMRENKMLLFLGEHNLDDFSRIFQRERWPGSKLGWFANQSEFFHEMLHEFQYKAVSQPTDEGRSLFAKYGHRHSDPGHDELWFTAIAQQADYFGLTPDELYAEL